MRTETFRTARDGEGEANFVTTSSFPSGKGLEKLYKKMGLPFTLLYISKLRQAHVDLGCSHELIRLWPVVG